MMTKLKNIKNLKKKIFGIALVVGILVVSIVSSTMAYFTDTDEKTNVFTSGNVRITLNSDIFTVNGTSDAKASVYPGQQIANGATVKNTGTEEAYVGVVINFKPGVAKDDVLALLKDENGASTLDLTKFAVTYVATETTSALYIVCNEKISKDASKTFFGKMYIPADWDANEDTNANQKMSIFANLDMTVKAYATQTVGFNGGATEALQAAFATDWEAITSDSAILVTPAA